ncbi:MAG: hypothetical protein LBK50_01615, partial [Candidatus Nomurabacteria bacterium]|nr:hypothetical protein [Candidatus Nomurabacteria bacterium]
MLKIYGKSKIVKRIVMSIVGLFLLAIPAGFIIVNHFAHNSNAATPTTVTPDSGPTAGGTPITITGDFSPPQPKTMQEMTVEYCASMTEFDGSNADAILTLYDARGDGASKVQAYRVAKLADGNCWMLDNLRFQLTEGMVLDGKTSNITGSGNPTVRFNWLGYNASGVTRNGNFVTNGYLTKTGATFSSASDQDAWRQVDPTSNAYCNDGQTYNPDSLTKCGYLYNWYTATAGSLDSGTVSADNIAPSSICPAGWRLPRGYNADATRNDFAVLNGYMHGDGAPNQDNPANSDYAKNWLQGGPFQGTLSGSWNTTYNGIHITGDLWSSTRVSNTNA